jgi:hypothetical protein
VSNSHTPRERAKAAGQLRFSDPDRPCRTCKGIERLTSHDRCVRCDKAAKKRYNVRKRTEQREALGLPVTKVAGDMSDPMSEVELDFAREVFMATLRIRFVAAMGSNWASTYCSPPIASTTTTHHPTNTDED